MSHAVRKDMQLARLLDDEELDYQLDCIDDELQLAMQGIYGTVTERRSDFEALLKQECLNRPNV